MNFIPLNKLQQRKHKNGKTVFQRLPEPAENSLSSQTREVGIYSQAANDSVSGQANFPSLDVESNEDPSLSLDGNSPLQASSSPPTPPQVEVQVEARLSRSSTPRATSSFRSRSSSLSRQRSQSFTSPDDNNDESNSSRIRIPPRSNVNAPEDDVRRNFSFEHGLNPLTKVLDVPFDALGSLCGVSNPIKFIPECLVKPVRAMWTNLLKGVTDHHDPRSNNPELLLAHKKLFFFPVIIFDNVGNAKDVKALMKSNLNLMFQDRWDSFTLGSLNLRPFRESSEATDTDRRRKTSTFVQHGRLSRGYQEWVKPRSSIQQNDAVFESLCPLFPEPGPDFFTPEQRESYIQRVAEFENSRHNDEFASIERVGKIIMKRENLIKPGFDHIRAEFEKKCWGYSPNDPFEVDFRVNFTKLINLVVAGRVPEAVQPIFCDTEAFAIPKKDGNIRPLGTSNFVRKIAGVVALQLNYAPINTAFSGIQLGFEKHGTEKIIHSMRLVREVHPEYDSASPDGVNAFPNSSREVALDETLRRTPGMFPLLNMLYGKVSKSWFFGCQAGIKSIDCKQGSVQGCSLGPFECAMAFLSLFQRIASLIVGFGLALFFFDDGHMVTTFSKMIEALQILIEQGPKFGYKIHFDKGDFLLGAANSLDIARDRKQQLIDLGFKPESIKIHPDDILLGSNEDILDLGFEDIAAAREAYGARILGGYIGEDAFIDAQLRAKALELEIEADRLIELGDPQQCYIFLRFCFGEKINHILRTTYPHLVEELARRFDHAKKKVLCFILDQFDAENIPDWLWSQACFTINDGGLGLKDSIRTSHAAFIASVTDCYPQLEKICPGFISQDLPLSRAVRDSLAFISAEASIAGRDPVNLTFQNVQAMASRESNRGGLQYLLSQLMDDAVRKSFKDSLTNKHLAFYNSVACESAGLWLNALPKNDTSTFQPSKFRVLLNNRLYLRQPEYSDGLRCDCVLRKEHPVIDERGHHLITACNKAAMGIRIHHACALAIKDLAQSAGFRAKTEEVGTFREYNGLLTETEKKMRGDVTIFDLPGGFKKTILDVSNTCVHPILSDVSFPRELAKVETAAQKRYDERVKKFDHAAKALKFKFQPIIFEITGRMHAKSEAFINSVLKHITGFKDGALLQDYWRKKISCIFQQEVGTHILDKLRMLKGSGSAHQHFENRSVYAFESALTDSNMR